MGGGLGSVLHMITTLRNNRNLLRKSNIFKRKKHYFEVNKEDYFAGSKRRIEVKPISAEELEKIRVKTKTENRRTTILSLSFSLVTITILALVTILIVKHLVKSQKEYELEQKRIIEAQRIAESEEKRKEYSFYIHDGDSWLNKKNYRNAIFQYNMALITDFNNYEAKKRLMLVYSLQCTHENIGCEYSIYQLEQLISQYPNDMELYELIIGCKEFIGDTTKLNKYYTRIADIDSTTF